MPVKESKLKKLLEDFVGPDNLNRISKPIKGIFYLDEKPTEKRGNKNPIVINLISNTILVDNPWYLQEAMRLQSEYTKKFPEEKIEIVRLYDI